MQAVLFYSTAVLFAVLVSASALPARQNGTAPHEHAVELKDCGIVYFEPEDTPDRIIDGRDAYAGEFPWLVSLREANNRIFGPICGGAILNTRWVLTAAHCFYEDIEDSDPPAYNIRDSTDDHDIVVGLLNQREIRGSASVRKVKIHKLSDIIIHARYNFFTNVNDIALLRTVSPIDIKGSNGYVNSVCLPKPNAEPIGMAAVGGWGDLVNDGVGSDMLKAVDLEIRTRESCEVIEPNLGSNMICAGRGGKDTCQGDSGGPLVQYDKSGRATVVGVVSYGDICGKSAGIYTKVSGYISWIRLNAE